MYRFALRKVLFNYAIEDLFNVHATSLTFGAFPGLVESRIYFGSSQAVMQMITTSSKLSIPFLLKGKIMVYKLSVTCVVFLIVKILMRTKK